MAQQSQQNLEKPGVAFPKALEKAQRREEQINGERTLFILHILL
jgi:hypothetical protein